MRGFTTIRDLGGPTFGLKRAIDEGLVAGPRIYPSGAVITITSGHGDFRQLYDLPRTIGGTLSRVEQLGGSMIADSPDEVRLRAREQLMQGASQIKLTAGGGVASPLSPLDVSTFTEEELRAAVEAAENWGTYVTVHAYTPAAIQRAIAAGVKCIEHGHLMDEATARLMAEKGIWLSTQPFLDAGDGGAFRRARQNRPSCSRWSSGTDTVYALAKKYKLKTAFGTDILFSASASGASGQPLGRCSSAGIRRPRLLMMATATTPNCSHFPACAIRTRASLASIEEGAFADLLLVDGDPAGRTQPGRRPGNELHRDHERREDLQKCALGRHSGKLAIGVSAAADPVRNRLNASAANRMRIPSRRMSGREESYPSVASGRPASGWASASRRDSRRSRAWISARASRPRHISPAADRAGIWCRPAPHTAPA